MFRISFLLFFSLSIGCREKFESHVSPGLDEGDVRINILYTNDEHGWMEKHDDSGGAASMMQQWQSDEGYSPGDSSFLILSGGDMWTGPAISTWFQGESMVEVMNAMGYSAAAIGNHEFDFGVTVLKERILQSEFPYLAANLREISSDKVPEFCSQYIIRDVKGVRIGIIGLASIHTPFTAFPEHVKDYHFHPYDQSLREIVPRLKAEDTDLLLVAGHICLDELRPLSATASELGIHFMGGGHCHEKAVEIVNGVTIAIAGANLESYAKIEIIYNKKKEQIKDINASIRDNKADRENTEIASMVINWKQKTDAVLSKKIGYAEQTIEVKSTAMENMITDSWLWAMPSARVSVLNTGGIRQDIPAGDISLGTIVGVLPFENNILELELTGNELIQFVQSGSYALGGMTTIESYSLLDGSPVIDDSLYKTLTVDYLYGVHEYLREYDPEPYNTGILYRQPLIDWINSMQTSPEKPINNYLDSVPRN